MCIEQYAMRTKNEVAYIKEIRNLMTKMKYDRKQIIGSKEVPRNVKLYLKLLSNKNRNDLFVN